jgi:hypothetical protein
VSCTPPTPGCHPLVKDTATDVSRKSYVDRKIAELDLLDHPLSQQASSFALPNVDHEASSTPGGLMRTRQPAGVGKLLEIDLGPDTTLENIARTAAAQRRLETGEPEALPAKPAKKPRLGRDGKPWRPRKGRNEDDIKRDQLVEAVLRESKCRLLLVSRSLSCYEY